MKLHSRTHKWKPTNDTEMKQFISILLLMGYIHKTTLESYWTKDRPVKNVISGPLTILRAGVATMMFRSIEVGPLTTRLQCIDDATTVHRQRDCSTLTTRLQCIDDATTVHCRRDYSTLTTRRQIIVTIFFLLIPLNSLALH